MKVYLAGSIQDARDGGVKWRDKITPKLDELGWDVLDPTKSEANITPELETMNEAKETLYGWVASGNWNKFQEHMKKVRDMDIAMVRKSDLVVVHLDHNYKHGGTYCEMWVAFIRRIPIYVVSYDPKKDFNHWILSMILDGGKLFDSWAQLLEGVEKLCVKAKS